jgi:hypothetical protein
MRGEIAIVRDVRARRIKRGGYVNNSRNASETGGKKYDGFRFDE